jgi:hypothetical protein
MKTLKKDGGYLFVDHGASPGLPEAVARASGYDPAFCKEGGRFEAASLTCAHCKAAVVKNPLRLKERAACMKCFHYICDLCAALMSLPDYDHMPFERRVDLIVGSDKPPPVSLVLPPHIRSSING